MSYLYKKPTITVQSQEASQDESKEQVNVIGSHITEISYEEHLKNLDLMCRTDREFMSRLRSFCEENSTDIEPVVSQNKKPTVDSEDENHDG